MTNVTNKVPTRTAIRDKVYDVVDGEREFQQINHPSPLDPSLVDETNLLIEYTDKLAVDMTVDPNGSSPAGGPLKRLREIAAIAIRAMEHHGAQPRENHVPASAGITGTVHITGKPDSTKPAPKVANPSAGMQTRAPAPTPHPTAAPAPAAAPHPQPSTAPARDAERHQAAPVPQHDTTEHGK